MKQRHHYALLYGLFALVLALNFAPGWASRNGSGTYTIPNTFSAGSTITASGFNQNFSDLASEITNSVAADGQTSMTGPLKHSNGSVSAPSMTFASDTDSGFYRIGGNNVGLSLGGTKIIDASSSGILVTGDVDGTIIKQGTYRLVPAGAVVYYAGSAAPDGWLLGDGTAVSRTTYATLFANISTTYGTGNGSTTFNLPDCTGRMIAGKEGTATRLTSAGSGVDGATLGATGGAETVTLARANLPNTSVAVTITDPGHTHTTVAWTTGGGNNFIGTNSSMSNIPITSSSNTTGITAAFNLNGNVTQTAVNKLPPTIVMNCIVKF